MTNIKNFYELMENHSSLYANKIAFKQLNSQLTVRAEISFSQLHQKAIIMAKKFGDVQARKLTALLLFPTTIDYIIGFLGCVYAGVIAVPVFMPRRSMHMQRLMTIMKNAKADHIITTRKILEQVKEYTENISFFEDINWYFTDDLMISDETYHFHISPCQEEIAMLQYTSGSTSDPKGVVLTQENLFANFSMMKKSFSTTAQSTMLTWIPLYHDMGLISHVLHSLYIGSTNILMSSQDFIQKPYRWLKAITDHQVKFSGAPNFAYDLCVKRIKEEDLSSLDLTSWRIALTAAEPIVAQTMRDFSNHFSTVGFNQTAFHPAYGLAEATVMVSSKIVDVEPLILRFSQESLRQKYVNIANENDTASVELVSCGHVAEGLTVKIVDEVTGKVCNKNVIGEIWVNGPSVAQGYWQNNVATEKTYNVSIVGEDENKKYLRTGDLGFFIDNELFVCARLKDVIIIGGENFYPQDLEYAATKAHPAIIPSAVAAFSVTIENSEKIVIVAELNRHYLKQSQDQSEAIAQVVNSIKKIIVSEYDVMVHDVLLIRQATIPKTTSGKIQRSRCKAFYLQHKLVSIEQLAMEVHV